MKKFWFLFSVLAAILMIIFSETVPKSLQPPENPIFFLVIILLLLAALIISLFTGLKFNWFDTQRDGVKPIPKRSKQAQLNALLRKEVLILIYHFFSAPYRVSIDNLGIHEFNVVNKNGIIVVNIKLERPGVFIGPRGETMDALKKFLSDRLGKLVMIHLEEFSIWQEVVMSTETLGKV